MENPFQYKKPKVKKQHQGGKGDLQPSLDRSY